MGRLGFCARIFRNVCTFLITCKIELRGRSNLPPDRRLGQRSGGVVCPPPVVARRCPFGICSSFACYPALRPLVAARHRIGSRARSVWCKLFSLLFACRPDLASVRCPAGRSPWASLLSTPRSLATRSTGAFSCRRSRCFGRRLLPPSVVLAGRGSLARGVPRG